MFTRKPDQDVRRDQPPRPTNPQRRLETGGTPQMANPSQMAMGSGGTALSVIGDDLTITGNVVSKGEVQIDGLVQGDVHCGTLLVGDQAQITGSVFADDVVVRGRVLGSVRGTRVTLQDSSHVEGDIYHQSLAIEQGAYFEGKSRRSDDPAITPEQVQEATRESSQPQQAAPQQSYAQQPISPQPHGGYQQPSSKPPRAAE